MGLSLAAALRGSLGAIPLLRGTATAISTATQPPPSTLPAWLAPGGVVVPLGQWVQLDGLSGRPNSSLKANFPNTTGTAAVSPDAGILQTAGFVGASDLSGSWGVPGIGISTESGACRMGTAFYIHGGGGAHGWAGNEWRKYDIGLDSPTWRIVTTPSPASVVSTAAVAFPGDPNPDRNQYYTDGKPISMHSYWRPQAIEQTGAYANHLVLPGFTMGWYQDSEGSGVTAPDGALYNERFTGYNLSTGSWYADNAEISPGVKRFPDLPAQGLPGNLIVKHPIVGTAFDECIFVCAGFKIYVFDPRHPELGWPIVCNSTVFGPTWYGAATIDTTARRLVCLFINQSTGTPFHGYYFNLGATPQSTITPVHYTLTGPGGDASTGLVYNTGPESPKSGVRPSLCYDPGLDCLIVFQGDQRLWTMKKDAVADTFDVQVMGTTIGPAISNWATTAAPSLDMNFGASKGGHGRMQHFPQYGGIGLIHSSNPRVTPADETVYFIRTTNVGPPADTTAPTIAITAPIGGALVTGTVTVTVNAEDDVGVTQVQYFVSGALAYATTTSPFAFSWDTSTVANGATTLQATAFDAAGNSGTSAVVIVTVSNAVADTTPPTISITSPSNGATVSGSAVQIVTNAADNVGVAKVEFYANGSLAGTVTVPPWQFLWSSFGVANGACTLLAKAYDAANNSASSSISVTVNNVAASGLYPADHFTPTYTEMAPSDVIGTSTYYEGAMWKQAIGGASRLGNVPGQFSSQVSWDNQGGDYFDKLGNRVTTTSAVGSANAYATVSVTDTDSTKPVSFADVTQLVKDLITNQNYGVGILRTGGTTGPIYLVTKWDNVNTTLRPSLTITDSVLGTATLTVNRNAVMDQSALSPNGIQNPQCRISSATNMLMWWDLSAYTNAANITSASLNLWTTAQFGGMTLGLFRVWCPQDQASLPAQRAGIAQNYILDANIISHPDVLFVEQLTDPNYAANWSYPLPANLGALNPDGSGLLVGARQTVDDPSKGFTKLLGQFNALKYFMATGSSNVYQQKTWNDLRWSPWRQTGSHPKGRASEDDLYFRYYYMFANDWNPGPLGGKLAGWYGGYNYGIPEDPIYMGNGNSGQGVDGFTGYTVRGAWSLMPDPLGTTPNLVRLNSYNYNMDQDGAAFVNGSSFGESTYWNKFWLNFFRRNTWYCVEQHLKMNSVTVLPAVSVTQAQVTATTPDVLRSDGTYGNIATVTLTLAQPDPNIAVNDYIWITGTAPTEKDIDCRYGNNQCPRLISVVPGPPMQISFQKNNYTDATQQWVKRPLGYVYQGGPITYEHNIAHPDGVLEVWVNGFPVAQYYNYRWRQSLYCRDGTTPQGIDSVWLDLYGNSTQNGGGGTVYLSNIVVARQYIGPIKVS